MEILIKIILLAVLGALMIATVRFLILPGLNIVSENLKLGSKARGQILGYATSIPEFVVVISAACSGVFDAGFWNIASSNIINWVLFLSAVICYKQYNDLRDRSFVDEISFGAVSVVLPVVFYLLDVQGSIWLAFGLFLLFVIYRILDRYLNSNVEIASHDDEVEEVVKRKTSIGVLLIIAGVVMIVLTGKYLGQYASELIVVLNVPVWMVGWLLGFITSIPEMSSFFEIYRYHKKKGTLKKIDDTQEALDALVSSNMSNLGIILPVGIFLFYIL